MVWGNLFGPVVRTAVLTALTLAGATCSRPGESVVFEYRNPNPQLEFRDTHIVPDDGRFYAVGTSAPFWEGANPGVKLFVSDDLIDWSFAALLIDAARLADDVWYKDRFWAPELHKIDGRYYVTFNCQNNSGSYAAENPRHFHACGLAVSDDILGPYTVLTHDAPLTPFASNDLSLFQDDDGRVYAFFNNGWTDIHHIFVAELDLEKGRLLEEPVRLISQEPGTWDGGGIEGAHVLKHDGVYYLFYSSWTKGYAVGYATAADIRGPWTKSSKNPLFGAFREGNRNFLFKEGRTIDAPDSPYVTVGRSEPVMLMDPIWFEDGEIKTHAPTYTPQKMEVRRDILERHPGLKRRAAGN